MKERTY